MATLLLSVIVSLLAIAGLAIGVIAGRAPIKGSCGGLSCLKGANCGACTLKNRREAR